MASTITKTLDSVEFYTASGSQLLTAGAVTDVLTVTFPHSGTWLVLSFMDLDRSVSDTVYVHSVSTTDMTNGVRTTPNSGGGSCSWAVTNGSSAVIKGYISSSGVTARVKVIYICLQ